MLRTVRLYGKLGARFGRVHRLALDSNSPAEAVQALASQFRGFTEFLMRAKDHGMAFAVFSGRRNLSKDELEHPAGAEDIRIAPVLLGSKNGGVFQVILGAVLIVVGLYASTFGLSPEVGAGLVSTGIAMAAGGVVQLLSPHPRGLGSGDKPANTPSYSFNGPVNTEAQGHPVPLLYGGPLKVGSAVVSAGITVSDTALAAQAPPTGSRTMGYGGDRFATHVLAP